MSASCERLVVVDQIRVYKNTTLTFEPIDREAVMSEYKLGRQWLFGGLGGALGHGHPLPWLWFIFPVFFLCAFTFKRGKLMGD